MCVFQLTRTKHRRTLCPLPLLGVRLATNELEAGRAANFCFSMAFGHLRLFQTLGVYIECKLVQAGDVQHQYCNARHPDHNDRTMLLGLSPDSTSHSDLGPLLMRIG